MKDKDETFWKHTLTPEQYRVLREKGTEAPFTGELLHNKETGMYVCAACGTPLFSSDTKFDSGTGWPSFYDVVKEAKSSKAGSPDSPEGESRGNVELRDDTSHGPPLPDGFGRASMKRTEVVCATCGGHLGHLFDDGPEDKTGKRYCINSCALDFRET